jgi:hypothetical protein
LAQQVAPKVVEHVEVALELLGVVPKHLEALELLLV